MKEKNNKHPTSHQDKKIKSQHIQGESKPSFQANNLTEKGKPQSNNRYRSSAGQHQSRI